MPDANQMLTWLIIGGLAGAGAASIAPRKMSFSEMVLTGLVGAVVGGVLINMLGIELPDVSVTVSLADLITAFVGALILIVAMGIFFGGRWRERR